MATKVGRCQLISGDPNTGLDRIVRLQLTSRSLTVQQRLSSSDSNGGNEFDRSGLPSVREVSLCRDHRGSFGFSVRGGSEHRLPIFVSHVARNMPAAKTKALFIGDALLRIDQCSVEGAAHAEAVQRLQNAGQQVTLVVRHFREAARLLRSAAAADAAAAANANNVNNAAPAASAADGGGNRGGSWRLRRSLRQKQRQKQQQQQQQQQQLSVQPDEEAQVSDEASGANDEDPWIAAAAPLLQKRAPLASESFSTFRTSSSSLDHCTVFANPNAAFVTPAAAAAAATTTTATATNQWTDAMTVPLLFARINRHLPGTDQLRSCSFEVVGISGHSSGWLTFAKVDEFNEWLAAVQANIQQLLDSKQQQHKSQEMCWLWLTLHESPIRSCLWQPVFLALRNSELLLFEVPPVYLADWAGCSVREKLWRCVVRVLDDSELLDKRLHSFFLHCGTDTFYMSAGSAQELNRLEQSCFRATSLALEQMSATSTPVAFSVQHNGEHGELTFDLERGVAFVGGSLRWRFPFGSLRRSCDDRDSGLFLHFADESGAISVKELHSMQLQQLLIVLHSLLSSKLTVVDPQFLKLS